ncbi:hypothetical protein G7Y89_g5924 [Cudoniella acicularis]|uniref:Uncharacterized protein n=1 Tax=Cudoniella acicularis TaxID=354080 RepID=A0A8H4W3C2_9HELO|nr:hypothetical protein G7Y89_g5924 [Cudoniella acicularis]
MAAIKSSGERVLGKGKSDAGITGLHFVVSSSVEKPNPELRKFIRSHVMIGKNRGKTLPPRKRKQKGLQDGSFSSPDAISASPPSPGEFSASSTATTATTVSHPVLPVQVTVPRKFGSDVSTIRFAAAVQPGTVEIVLQFASIAKQILFSLETCILFERRAQDWIAPLALDPAYLHSSIFTSQYYFDAILPGKSSSSPLNQRILPHYLKTLELLRERFASDDDDQARLSNTTVAAVMSLAGHAYFTGDSKSARHHMEGLRKIINLRGGVTTFRNIGHNAKLLVEMLRCDIGMALYSGSKPVFFNGTSSREPSLPYPDLTPLLNLRKPAATNSQYNPAIFSDKIDEEVARAWRIVSQFCSVINFAVDTGQRISTETFLDTMASVAYRLLNMRFDAGSSDEAIRLGLLAFSCSVFLQWRHLGMSYPHFTSVFRGCLARLASPPISPQLLVWLLMIGAISVFDATDEGWLKPVLLVNMALCEIGSWSKMQELLKSFIWIGLVHDKPGKVVFDSTIA